MTSEWTNLAIKPNMMSWTHLSQLPHLCMHERVLINFPFTRANSSWAGNRKSVVFIIELRIDLDIRALKLVSRTNFELGPQFAQVWFPAVVKMTKGFIKNVLFREKLPVMSLFTHTLG